MAAGVACAVVIAQTKPDARVQSAPASPSPASLPQLGKQLTPLPDGAGKAIAEGACLSCHASDILRQQRLTRQQWTGTLTKMVNWGTVIPDGQRDLLLDYLSSNFGPENASFQPAAVRPIGK
jgi:mono/diheme cytochrome c family protein